MEIIPVEAARPYKVMVGPRLLQDAGRLIRPCVTGKTVAIVSDENVAPLYADPLCKALEQEGFQVCLFRFPAGEVSKSLAVYGALLSFLAEHGLTREDCIVALGGGVTGDLAGFAAATYLRGIPYVQVPTSLLAMVDSSVGGKTAIDLPAGKNLCGAFWQPRLVLCDCDLLDTLPEASLLDGYSEIIKYGVLEDDSLMQISAGFDRESVIARCVQIKAAYVHSDECDYGQRQMLNLGHTVGHAIEICSHYVISHGIAVAAGLAIVSRGAAKLYGCPSSRADAIIAALSRMGLPTTAEFTAQELLPAILHDKKQCSEGIGWILPQGKGCKQFMLSAQDSLALLEAGL